VTAPHALDFGRQVIGRRVTRDITFMNPSKRDVLTQGVTISGGASFSVASQCGPLTGRQSCTAEVTFAPSTEGAQSATISLAGTSARASVSGFGVTPRSPIIHHLLKPSVGSIDFATDQGAQSVTFTNAGNDRVLIALPKVDDNNFLITTTSNCANKVLFPSDQCVVTVVSQLTKEVVKGTLAIISVDGKVEASVALSSQAAPPPPPPLPPPQPPSGPHLRTDRTTINFAPQKLKLQDANVVSRYLEMARCDKCPHATFNIINDGPGMLSVQSVKVDQNAESFGAVALNCSSLAEGARCLVVVFWKQQSAGGRGRVGIDSNSVTTPDYINIE
jgi:hypothetical protein